MKLFFKSCAILTLTISLTANVMAQTNTDNVDMTDNKTSIEVDCKDTDNGQGVYSSVIESAKYPAQVKPGELFDVEIVLRNTGNTTWFSELGGCENKPFVFLGTEHATDRQSVFFAPGIFGKTGWKQANRIRMSTPVVSPDKTATFTFKMHAPEKEGLYKEFMKPVAENMAWFDQNSEIPMLIKVGNPQYDPKLVEITSKLKQSINLLDSKLNGQKKIVIQISTQKMKVFLGDSEIKSFPVSTGTTRTPTPFGNFSIQFKQNVRVGGKWPHYIMPRFMQFKAGGYGIHALPSLANDRGVFWREALNHIGTRRSHGCVRLLPGDADWLFEFAEVGTPVQVIR